MVFQAEDLIESYDVMKYHVTIQAGNVFGTTKMFHTRVLVSFFCGVPWTVLIVRKSKKGDSSSECCTPRKKPGGNLAEAQPRAVLSIWLHLACPSNHQS